MKYRIKSRQTFFLWVTNSIPDDMVINYQVQVKLPLIPIWFTVTRSFIHKSHAEEYIELILDEKG